MILFLANYLAKLSLIIIFPGCVGLVEEELYQEASTCAIPEFTKESSTEMMNSVQESYRTSAGGAIGGLEQTDMGQFSAAKRTYKTTQFHPDGEHVVNQVATNGMIGTGRRH